MAHLTGQNVEIHVSIETTGPLTGTARAGNQSPLPFEGWLELLRVLSTLMEVE